MVELEVLLDLALALALGRLVDGELDLPLAVRHHLRHERRVLRRDVLVGEVQHLGHPEDALVEPDPVVHPAELDVARRRGRPRAARRRPPLPFAELLRDVAGEVRALVAGAVDEGVHDVAVGPDRGEPDLAELVLRPVRLDDPARAALHRLAVGLARVGHAQRDVLHAVAVGVGEVADRRVAPQPARDDERGSRPARGRSSRGRGHRSRARRRPSRRKPNACS